MSFEKTMEISKSLKLLKLLSNFLFDLTNHYF